MHASASKLTPWTGSTLRAVSRSSQLLILRAYVVDIRSISFRQVLCRGILVCALHSNPRSCRSVRHARANTLTGGIPRTISWSTLHYYSILPCTKFSQTFCFWAFHLLLFLFFTFYLWLQNIFVPYLQLFSTFISASTTRSLLLGCEPSFFQLVQRSLLLTACSSCPGFLFAGASATPFLFIHLMGVVPPLPTVKKSTVHTSLVLYRGISSLACNSTANRSTPCLKQEQLTKPILRLTLNVG